MCARNGEKKSGKKIAIKYLKYKFSNHYTIIGCTAPVSARQIVELAGVLLYHYIVLYQDPSGNECSVYCR